MGEVKLAMSVREFKKLADYLDSHEHDIAGDINDFEDLKFLYELVFGIPAKPT